MKTGAVMAAPEIPPGAWTFRPLGRYRAQLGEGPILSQDGKSVWWVDTEGHRLIRTDIETEAETVWSMPEAIGFVAEAWRQVVVGMQSGLFCFQPTTAALTLIPGTDPGPGMRYNDACVDASGAIWTGTMDMDGETPRGVLMHFAAPGPGRTIASGLRRINGLAHDQIHAELVMSDSHPASREIWRIDLASGCVTLPSEPLTRLRDREGRPDGACTTADGRYLVATLEGGALLEISRTGARGELIQLPVALPTKAACDITGRLFVTSKMSSSLGGRLLVCEHR